MLDSAEASSCFLSCFQCTIATCTSVSGMAEGAYAAFPQACNGMGTNLTIHCALLSFRRTSCGGLHVHKYKKGLLAWKRLCGTARLEANTRHSKLVSNSMQECLYSCCISITGCLSPFKDTKLQVAVAGTVSSFGEKRRKGGKVNNYPAF